MTFVVFSDQTVDTYKYVVGPLFTDHISISLINQLKSGLLLVIG